MKFPKGVLQAPKFQETDTNLHKLQEPVQTASWVPDVLRNTLGRFTSQYVWEAGLYTGRKVAHEKRDAIIQGQKKTKTKTAQQRFRKASSVATQAVASFMKFCGSSISVAYLTGTDDLRQPLEPAPSQERGNLPVAGIGPPGNVAFLALVPLCRRAGRLTTKGIGRMKSISTFCAEVSPSDYTPCLFGFFFVFIFSRWYEKKSWRYLFI